MCVCVYVCVISVPTCTNMPHTPFLFLGHIPPCVRACVSHTTRSPYLVIGSVRL